MTDDAGKAVFRGTVAFLAYLFIVMVVLWMPVVSNQPFIQALFPLPLPNGNISYYQFIIFFGWIVGIPMAVYWFLIRPIPSATRRGFHR